MALFTKGVVGFVWAGFFLVLSAAVIWTHVGNRERLEDSGPWPLIAAVVGVFGTIVFGLGLGYRLRLRVEVLRPDGKKSPVSAAFVAAQMTVMGSGSPEGLLVPQGSDIANLPESALSVSAGDGLAAAIIKMVRALVSWEPWKLQVVLVDGHSTSVASSWTYRRWEWHTPRKGRQGPRTKNLSARTPYRAAFALLS